MRFEAATSLGALFVHGRAVVSGLRVVPPASHGGPPWAKLDRGDARARPDIWIRQIIVHSTKGLWPQTIAPVSGLGGESARIADIWQTDPVHSAAQIIVDSAGVVTCLCDVGDVMAYHAEGSNPWSVGIEMVQQADGTICKATIDATAQLCIVLCTALSIPAQHHAGWYANRPLERMEHGEGRMRSNTGGPDCVGIFGHRDNTSARGRGDPGDAIYDALTAAGSEPLHFDLYEDLEIGRQRQRVLVERGEKLVIDGLVGPASMAAAHRHFDRWRDVA